MVTSGEEAATVDNIDKPNAAGAAGAAGSAGVAGAADDGDTDVDADADADADADFITMAVEAFVVWEADFLRCLGPFTCREP
jgi:hypothetical protein